MKSKSYRGFTWKTNEELASLLNRSPRTIADWRRKHNGSNEDYIDHYLQEGRYKNNHVYSEHYYRGIAWNGTDKDLGSKLGLNQNKISKLIVANKCDGCTKRSKNPCRTNCKLYFSLRERVIDMVLGSE